MGKGVFICAVYCAAIGRAGENPRPDARPLAAQAKTRVLMRGPWPRR